MAYLRNLRVGAVYDRGSAFSVERTVLCSGAAKTRTHAAKKVLAWSVALRGQRATGQQMQQRENTTTMKRATAFVGAVGLSSRPLTPSSAQTCRASNAATCMADSSLRRSHFAPGFSHGPRANVRRVSSVAWRTVQPPVAMAKQMETDWNPVKVLENTVVCEEHRYLVLNVGITGETGSLCDAFRVPGMYVQIRPNADVKPGFFAISCAPNVQGIFEFLIKDNPKTDWITTLSAGDTVEVSPVMGNGFPVSKQLDLFQYPPVPEGEQPKDVLLFATGSGIAPIRSVIESRLNGINPAQRRSVKLYYGARYPERMPYKDRFPLWQSDNIEVIPVMSQPDKGQEPWDGRKGYIQDALREDGIASPAETGAVLCGVKGMTEEVKKILTDAGVKEDRILFNF